MQTREVLADRGDDAEATLASIAQQPGAVATIPPGATRTVQRPCASVAYRERPRIACFVGKLKHFRRVFSRFDKYATRFRAFVRFVRVVIWLRYLAHKALLMTRGPRRLARFKATRQQYHLT